MTQKKLPNVKMVSDQSEMESIRIDSVDSRKTMRKEVAARVEAKR